MWRQFLPHAGLLQRSAICHQPAGAPESRAPRSNLFGESFGEAPRASKYVLGTTPVTSRAANAAELSSPSMTPLELLQSVLQDKPGAQSAAEIKADLEAHEVLRKVVRENDQHIRQDVIGYAHALGEKFEQGVPLTIHEHTAVTFLLRS